MIPELKRRALHRTKIIEGQMRALETKIENDEYCMDILSLNLALQKSLASLNKLVLENHLRTHVTDSLSTGDTTQQEQTVNELLSLYELNNNRSK